MSAEKPSVVPKLVPIEPHHDAVLQPQRAHPAWLLQQH
jgi:hypothetical protein